MNEWINQSSVSRTAYLPLKRYGLLVAALRLQVPPKLAFAISESIHIREYQASDFFPRSTSDPPTCCEIVFLFFGRFPYHQNIKIFLDCNYLLCFVGDTVYNLPKFCQICAWFYIQINILKSSESLQEF